MGVSASWPCTEVGAWTTSSSSTTRGIIGEPSASRLECAHDASIRATIGRAGQATAAHRSRSGYFAEREARLRWLRGAYSACIGPRQGEGLPMEGQSCVRRLSFLATVMPQDRAVNRLSSNGPTSAQAATLTLPHDYVRAPCENWTKTILRTAFWSMFQPLIFHSTGTTATPTVSICLSS